MKKRKIMLILDSQKLDFRIPLKGAYDIVSNLLKKSRFKKAIEVARHLKKEGNEVVVVALDNRTSELLKKENIAHTTRSDVTGDLLELKYGELSFRFLRNLIKVISEVDPNSTYRGILLPYLDEKTLWRVFIQPVIKGIDTFTELIKKHRPTEVIILNSAHFYQRLFMLVAQDSGLIVRDLSGTLSHLPWKAKHFAIKNIGEIKIPPYFRNLKERPIHAPTKRKKKILIAHDTVNPKKVLPWAKKLTDKYEVAYIGVNKQGEDFEKAGIQYKRLYDYATESAIGSIGILKRIFHKDFSKVYGSPKLRAALNYKGIDLSSTLEEMFLYEYYIAYQLLVTYIELFNKMIVTELPDLVVTVDDRSVFGKTLIEVANSIGIKSLIVQHGALVDHPLFEKSNCTKYAAYGKQSREILLKRNFRREQIEIVGHAEEIPRDSPERIKRRICTKLNLSAKRPIVLFTTQAFSESVNYPSFNLFYNTAKEFPNIQFIVKLHPDEYDNFHKEFISRLQLRNVIIVKDIDVKELVIASDLLINVWSTVGMEAINLGKPLVSIDINLPTSYFPKSIGAQIVSDAKHLKEAIDTIIIKHKRPSAERIKRGSKYYIIATGEKACNNVVKLIGKMVE